MKARFNLMKENEARNEPREKSKGKVKKRKKACVIHSSFLTFVSLISFAFNLFHLYLLRLVISFPKALIKHALLSLTFVRFLYL